MFCEAVRSDQWRIIANVPSVMFVAHGVRLTFVTPPDI
jgi:hypothetical protein